MYEGLPNLLKSLEGDFELSLEHSNTKIVHFSLHFFVLWLVYNNDHLQKMDYIYNTAFVFQPVPIAKIFKICDLTKVYF